MKIILNDKTINPTKEELIDALCELFKIKIFKIEDQEELKRIYKDQLLKTPDKALEEYCEMYREELTDYFKDKGE